MSLEITTAYTPLPHQQPFVQYMLPDEKSLRAVLVWHRRSGKDLSTLNVTWVKSQQRVGTYYYFLSGTIGGSGRKRIAPPSLGLPADWRGGLVQTGCSIASHVITRIGGAGALIVVVEGMYRN